MKEIIFDGDSPFVKNKDEYIKLKSNKLKDDITQCFTKIINLSVEYLTVDKTIDMESYLIKTGAINNEIAYYTDKIRNLCKKSTEI